MAKAKHTPGPWRVDIEDRLYGADNIEILGAFEEYGWFRGFIKTEADVRLIAEAPNMLASLIEIEALATQTSAGVRASRALSAIINKAHAAIAKATGDQ